MDGRFLDAFTLLPKQRVICGYVTRPLCLRHRLVLSAQKSPFADGQGDVAPKHVLIAAKVMSGSTLAEMMPDKPSQHDLAEAKKLSEDKEYFIEQTTQIYEAIKEQSHWPTFWKKGNGAGGRGVPWMLSIIAGLLKGGMTLEEAWTMPESQAVWMHAAISIANGADIDIVSDEDLAAQRKLDELYARLEAGNSVE